MPSDEHMLSDLLHRANAAAEADTEDFRELAEILELDPKSDFAGADMAELHFRKEEFRGCDFRGTDFWHARFSACLFERCDLRGARLTEAHFDHSVLMACDLSGATLTGATIEATPVNDCRFVGADLRHASFVKSPLNKPDFAKVDLTDTEFVDSPIHDAAGRGDDVAEYVPEPVAALSDGLSLSDGPAHVLDDKDVRGILLGLGKWGENLARAVERRASSLGYKAGDEREAARLGVPYTVLIDDRDGPIGTPFLLGFGDQIIFSCGRNSYHLPFRRERPIILLPRQNAEAYAAPPPLHPAVQVTRALEVLGAPRANLGRGQITLVSTVSYRGTPDESAAALQRALLQAAMEDYAWEDALETRISIRAPIDPTPYLKTGRLSDALEYLQTTYEPTHFRQDPSDLTVSATFARPSRTSARPALQQSLAPMEPYRGETPPELYRLKTAKRYDEPRAALGDVIASFYRPFPTEAALRGLEEGYYVVDPALLVLLQGGATDFQKRFAVWSSLGGKARKAALKIPIARAIHSALKEEPETFDIAPPRFLSAIHAGRGTVDVVGLSTRRQRNGRALHCAGEGRFDSREHALSWSFSFQLVIDMDHGIAVTDISKRARPTRDI